MRGGNFTTGDRLHVRPPRAEGTTVSSVANTDPTATPRATCRSGMAATCSTGNPVDEQQEYKPLVKVRLRELFANAWEPALTVT